MARKGNGHSLQGSRARPGDRPWPSSAARNSKTRRLHVSIRSATAATSAVSANEPVSLSVSRIVTGRPVGVGDIDRAEVDGTDLGRVVIEKPDKLELRDEIRHDLLRPFPPKSAEQTAVARVQVAADPDRVPAVQPRIAAGVRPAHQEPPSAVSKDEIRDDLLERRVTLHLGTRFIAAVTLQRGDESVEAVGPHAVPASLVGDGPPRNDVDEFAVSRRPIEPVAHALAAGLRATCFVRAAWSLELGEPVVEDRA